jgi:hypothetical protein
VLCGLVGRYYWWLIMMGWDYVSELRPPTACCSFPGLYVSMEVGTIRASYLRIAFLVAIAYAAASRSRKPTFCLLLRKHRYSIPLLSIITLSSLTVNLFVKPSHAAEWLRGRRIRAEQRVPPGSYRNLPGYGTDVRNWNRIDISPAVISSKLIFY